MLQNRSLIKHVHTMIVHHSVQKTRSTCKSNLHNCGDGILGLQTMNACIMLACANSFASQLETFVLMHVSLLAIAVQDD